MELSEELCRDDLFYEFVVPKLETGTPNPLTPVTLSETDFMAMERDPNNNSLEPSPPSTTIKSFIDDMLFSPLQHPPHLDPPEEASGEESGTGSLGLLNVFNWSGGGGEDESCEGRGWESSALLDPIYIYSHHGDGTLSETLSSDLISSSFSPHSPSTSLRWLRQEDDSFVLTSSASAPQPSLLLRTALQGGPRQLGVKEESREVVIEESNLSMCRTKEGMSELRKVLSYPPISHHHILTHHHHHSPSSTSQQQQQHHSQMDSIEESGGGGKYYEFKILEPLHYPILPEGDEAHLPNVEELIMRKVSGPMSKIHSTTSLSSKWSYVHGTSPPQPIKRRRRKTKGPVETSGGGVSEGGDGSNNEVFLSTSSGASPTSSGSNGSSIIGGSRKERSLHYCNICNKGFKDKYSVTVHIRTHTGEKPFQCSFCGKNFRQKAHLAKHYQTHASKSNGHGKGKRGNSTIPHSQAQQVSS